MKKESTPKSGNNSQRSSSISLVHHLGRTLAISQLNYSNHIVECFKSGHRLFIAGDIDTNKDLTLISTLVNSNKYLKFIISPFTVSEERLNKIIASIKGNSLLYSECDKNTDFTSTQALIIDYFGDLPLLYRYGTWAYVGGGFSRTLHNLLEPAVYGLSLSFGPNYQDDPSASQLVELGMGTLVRSRKDIQVWLNRVVRSYRIIEKSEENPNNRCDA